LSRGIDSQVALELAEIAAGLPLAASFAMASGITAFREGRRRTALNEAMHEVRRPLQVLALSLPQDRAAAGAVESSLLMAVTAVDRLDCEINGRSPAMASARVSLRSVVETAVKRWQPRAAREGRPLSLVWSAAGTELRGDRAELAQAVDNLISNAVEHGRREITIEVREGDGLLRLAVRDRGGVPTGSKPCSRPRLRDRLAGRARRGHGLRIVRRVAARHGGSFRLQRSTHGSEARLDLPLVGGRG
jgi:signal transduction histidine kinase